METIYGFSIVVFAFLAMIGTVVPKFLKPLFRVVRLVAIVGILLLIYVWNR